MMIWAGIIGNELVGPFKVEDGVRIDSAGYTQFLQKNLMPWMKKKSAALCWKRQVSSPKCSRIVESRYSWRAF